MKVRLDFVTNSSSTSYCIVGIDADELGFSVSGKSDRWKYISEFSSSVYEKGLRFKIDEDGYCGVVGILLDDMGENETKRQFRNRVRSALLKAYPDAAIGHVEFRCDTYSNNV